MAARVRTSHPGFFRGAAPALVEACVARVMALPAATVLGGIVLIAAGLRLWSLGAWPIFSDEDGYLTAAITVAALPLTDWIRVATEMTLKAPFLVLVHAAIIRLGADPLLAGRMMQAAAGLVTTVLTWELARRLGGWSVGLVAAALYAVSPLAVLHDRMILLDPWLTTLTLAATLLSLIAIERRSLGLALLAAVAGALAVQVKTPGVLVLAAPALALIVRPRDTAPPTREAGLAMLGPVVSYFGLSISPIGPLLGAQNAMLMAPFVSLGENAGTVADSFLTYAPAGLALLMAAGMALALRESPRRALILAGLAAAWIVPWVVLSKFTPSRYDLPALPILCAFAALAMVRLPALVPGHWPRAAVALAMAAILGASALASGHLLVDHASARLSALDDWQYRTGWPSGYGYREATSLVHRVAEPGSSVAYVVDMYHVSGAGLFEPLPDGVRSLGLLDADKPLPSVSGRLYAIVDEGRDRSQIEGAAADVDRRKQVMAARPDLEPIATFLRPGAAPAVTVLRSR